MKSLVIIPSCARKLSAKTVDDRSEQKAHISYMPRGQNFSDIAGHRFGRLIAQWPTGIKGRSPMWLCVCDCGRLLIARGTSIRFSRPRSCGCQKREAARRHGMNGSPEYSSYHDAQSRCNNPNHQAWKDYGGRGIRFLFTDFQQFFNEIGFRPAGLTLDRIRNDGHYEPGNVRWATRSQQQFNTRTSANKPPKEVQARKYYLKVRDILRSLPVHFTKEEWESLKEKYGYICLSCRKRKPLTPDHVVPVCHGGSDAIENIQPLCGSCNSRKWTKHTDYRISQAA